jgi:hypothetical protein
MALFVYIPLSNIWILTPMNILTVVFMVMSKNLKIFHRNVHYSPNYKESEATTLKYPAFFNLYLYLFSVFLIGCTMAVVSLSRAWDILTRSINSNPTRNIHIDQLYIYVCVALCEWRACDGLIPSPGSSADCFMKVTSNWDRSESLLWKLY